MVRRFTCCVVAAVLCVALVHADVPAPGPPEPEPQGGTCDDSYECDYQYTVQATGVTYQWDFSLLCQSGGTYSKNDSGGHTYEFNICGTTAYRCLPEKWDAVYEYGVAVQYWGDAPPCNESAPNCADFDGHPHCCTEDCQVLGTGPPTFTLKDPQNPETGGIRIQHYSVPPSNDDPFWCGWDPNTGTQHRRSVVYDFECDPNGQLGQVDIIKAVENATAACDYTVFMKSKHGCGCAPECTGKNCGSDKCFGYCGSQEDGLCPSNYFCLDSGVCCRPDCSFRDCGGDGCGAQCGSNHGDCPTGETCVKSQCTPDIYSPMPTPVNYKNSGSTLAGAFFAGLITTVVLGAVGFFWYHRRGGSSYTPFSAAGGSSGTDAATSSATSFGKPTAYGAA